LPALAAWLAKAIREPGDLDRALRAARHLDGLGAAEQARLVLSRWIEGAERRTSPQWREAALQLASLERRAGERERAAELLHLAWLADPGCPEASEGWAKVLEHQHGDFAQALRVARGSREPCERRIARLEARLARARRDQPAPPPLEAPVRLEVVREAAPDPRPKPGLGPPRGAKSELLARIDQTESGAVVRYRLLR